MYSDYGETTYLILSKIVKLNFKAQIKNSGIEFRNIYRITDLESNFEYYSLITNGDPINFKNQSDFIKEFILFLEKNITYFNNQFEQLQKTANDRFVDKNAVFTEHEHIGNCDYKQSQILKKMKQFENNIG